MPAAASTSSSNTTPTVYGLDDWDQVEFIVKSVTDTDPHFA